MQSFPEKIDNEEQLDEMISRPGEQTVEMFSKLDGDIIFLGVGGKIGPSLAFMARRACDNAGARNKIFGVSLFENKEHQEWFEKKGITTIHGDLLDTGFLASLPKAENLFYLAGMKFGATDNLSMTWAINTYLPALVAENFKQSKIVVFSTGCVYPLVPVESGGSRESDSPDPVGEYAQSCLGRERMFEFGSIRNKTKVALIRLNYSVEMRYGVLVDIALRVKNNQPVDLTMGYFNVIWQGDMNDFVLRSLEHVKSPARVINITGPEILPVRDVAEEFGRLLNVKPVFINQEAPTALLNNSSYAYDLFGKPKMPVKQIIKWIAVWLEEEKRILDKPTHFEVRNGKY
jgi:nucleoside-diphosphate-sugar epimerase